MPRRPALPSPLPPRASPVFHSSGCAAGPSSQPGVPEPCAACAARAGWSLAPLPPRAGRCSGCAVGDKLTRDCPKEFTKTRACRARTPVYRFGNWGGRGDRPRGRGQQLRRPPHLQSTAPAWVPVGIHRLRASLPHPHPQPNIGHCPLGHFLSFAPSFRNFAGFISHSSPEISRKFREFCAMDTLHGCRAAARGCASRPVRFASARGGPAPRSIYARRPW